MKKFYIEVEVLERRYCKGHTHSVVSWGKVQSSNGDIYQYETAEEAIKIARMCYPDHPEKVRIVCE